MSGSTTGGLARLWDRLPAPMGLSTLHGLGLVGLLLLALVPVPLAVAGIQVSAATVVLYLMMFAISWDLFSGYTGQISLGHTLFFALGGYGSALLNLEFGISPLVGVPIGVVLAAVGGLLVGLPALRLRGPFLTVVTFVVPLVLLEVFAAFGETFGGRTGLSAPAPLVGTESAAAITITPPSILTMPILTYYVSFLALLLVLAVTLAITRVRAGDVFTAIREDEQVVEALGFEPTNVKLLAFVLSGAVGGFAGAMFVHTAGSPVPAQLLEADVAISVVVMAVIGGAGTIVGAAIGALFVGATAGLLGLFDVTIPALGVTPAELMPLPVYVVAGLVLYAYPPGLYGAFRAIIRRVGGEEEAGEDGDPATFGRPVGTYTRSQVERP